MSPLQIATAQRTAPCNVQPLFDQRKAVRLETNCGGAYRTETRITVGMDPSRMLLIFGTPDRVISNNFGGTRGEWLYGATVLLTSHYMADVEALCRRVVVIHHGRILYDGDLSGLAGQFSAHKTIRATLDDGAADLSRYGEVVEREGSTVTLRVPKAESTRIAARLLTDLAVADLTIEETPIEDVIDRVFTEAPAHEPSV